MNQSMHLRNVCKTYSLSFVSLLYLPSKQARARAEGERQGVTGWRGPGHVIKEGVERRVAA